MNILRCLVVDDEAPARRLLESYIAKTPFLELVASCDNALDAIAAIEKSPVDLVFLDIQMPTLTGIQLSRIVGNKSAIIFTTAYPQYAIESYELNATDYLLKPFPFDRFYQAVLKVLPQKENSKETSEERFLFVKTDGKNNFEKLWINDILYLESLKNYVCIHLMDKEIITYNTLKHFEEVLASHGFIKAHKSYLVAVRGIKRTDTDTITMTNDKNVPIGDTYRKAFFERINKSKI